MKFPVLFPNQALTFRSYSHTETERLLVRLRSLPEAWRCQDWGTGWIRVQPVSPGNSLSRGDDHKDVTIYGPRVSETDMALLMKLGRCVRYMEFEDDAPF